MQTDDILEDTLTLISEKIAKICKSFYDETGHPITSIDVSYDAKENVSIHTSIQLTGAVVVIAGEQDS